MPHGLQVLFFKVGTFSILGACGWFPEFVHSFILYSTEAPRCTGTTRPLPSWASIPRRDRGPCLETPVSLCHLGACQMSTAGMNDSIGEL